MLKHIPAEKSTGSFTALMLSQGLMTGSDSPYSDEYSQV
jgi:hypothetical protein